MNPLAVAMQFLDGAELRKDRIAALALAEEQAGMAAGIASSSMSVAEEAVARLLARRSHLILRGGARALLREALSEPAGSPVARMAEEVRRQGRAATGGATVPEVRVVRRGGTRPHDDGRARTLESGARCVGDVAFSSDGEYVCAFASGSVPWLDDGGDATFLQWRVATGELVAERRVGQFREENGSFAISPELRLLAVRDHRCIAVYELPVGPQKPQGKRPPKLHELRGAEGPYAITFLDEQHLVADDASLEMVVWNAATGERVASAPAIGWRDHAVARRSGRLLIAGSSSVAGRAVGVHALPSLEMLGTFRYGGVAARGGGCTEAIDVSPEEGWVATGEAGGAVWLWPMRELQDPERRSSPRSPLPVSVRRVGQHGDQVVAVRFLGEHRLLSGGWDHAVLCWDLRAAQAELDAAPGSASSPASAARGEPAPVTPVTPVRQLRGHVGWINALDVHPERHLAASCSEDGRVILWDLRGRGQAPPAPLPPVRKERSLRPHPDGLEVISDGVSTIIAWPSSGSSSDVARLPPVAQDPELIGITLDGFLVIPVDDPGPPQLHIYPADAPLVELEGDLGRKPVGDPLEIIELELHGAGLCALGPRSFALVEADGHVSFWELSP
jgi:WD domain, G-beta repeat